MAGGIFIGSIPIIEVVHGSRGETLVSIAPIAPSVVSGDVINFVATASSYGALTYQWQQGITGEAPWIDVGTAVSTYDHTSLINDPAGQYIRCVVTDEHGIRVGSDPALMSVAAAEVLLYGRGAPFGYSPLVEEDLADIFLTSGSTSFFNVAEIRLQASSSKVLNAGWNLTTLPGYDPAKTITARFTFQLGIATTEALLNMYNADNGLGQTLIASPPFRVDAVSNIEISFIPGVASASVGFRNTGAGWIQGGYVGVSGIEIVQS